MQLIKYKLNHNSTVSDLRLIFRGSRFACRDEPEGLHCIFLVLGGRAAINTTDECIEYVRL